MTITTNAEILWHYKGRFSLIVEQIPGPILDIEGMGAIFGAHF